MSTKKVNKNLLELRDEKLMRLEAKCDYIGAFKTNIKTLAERTKRRNLEKGHLARTAQNINTILYNWKLTPKQYRILEYAAKIIWHQLVHDLKEDQTRDRICTKDHRSTIEKLAQLEEKQND